jgi:hypothetical protein
MGTGQSRIIIINHLHHSQNAWGIMDSTWIKQWCQCRIKCTEAREPSSPLLALPKTKQNKTKTNYRVFTVLRPHGLRCVPQPCQKQERWSWQLASLATSHATFQGSRQQVMSSYFSHAPSTEPLCLQYFWLSNKYQYDSSHLTHTYSEFVNHQPLQQYNILHWLVYIALASSSIIPIYCIG